MNEEFLKNLYWKEELSTAKIGRKLGISQTTVYYWMKKLKIPRRQLSGRQELIELDEQLLRELYWDKKLSKNGISRELGVSARTIYRQMVKFKIPRRSVSESHKGIPLSEEHRRNIGEAQKGEKHHLYGKKRTEETRKKISEAEMGNKNQFYGKTHTAEFKRKMSLRMKGENHPLYGKKLSQEACRNNSEAKKGKKNPMYGKRGIEGPAWKGGISFEPYSSEFNGHLKNIIMERDNYTCQICKKPGICIHHIDYNKKNTNLLNLITLCISCHTKTNFNREFWITYFKQRLLEALG